MIRLALIISLLPAGLMARTMTCQDLTYYWSVDTITVVDNGGNNITITGTPNPTYTLGILLAQSTSASFDNSKFSFAVSHLNDSDRTYVPTSWLVNWEDVTLSHTSFGDSSDWEVNTKFECELIVGNS